MNYLTVYKQIIKRRKKVSPTGYTEQHHIIPRALGGSNNSYNIVKLTAREHFICHLLLTKIYPKDTLEYYKMICAFYNMCISSKNQKRITSRFFEKFRSERSNAMSFMQKGSKNSQYNTIWIHNKSLQQNKKISKVDEIEDGWERGRVIIWDSSKKKVYRRISQEEKDKKFNKSVEKYTELYKIYDQYGWKKFTEIAGYEYSQPNLIGRFKKYVKEFKEQNGKKRGTVLSD